MVATPLPPAEAPAPPEPDGESRNVGVSDHRSEVFQPLE
jgi:hypothetical protein